MILHVPPLIAVTTPLELTVATDALLLLHAPVPPPKTTPLAVHVVVNPWHIGVAPPVTEVILALGVTFTVAVPVIVFEQFGVV